MANRYWVGGTGSWNSTSRWSTSSGGGSGASVPTSADNAIFDANSGSGTCTMNVSASCLNFDWSASSLSTFASSSGVGLSVYGDFTLKAGMTNTNVRDYKFLASSGTTQTITTAGVTLLGDFRCQGTGTVLLADDLTLDSGKYIYMEAAGTLSNGGGGNVMSARYISSAAGSTLILGSATHVFSGANGAPSIEASTLDAGTSTLKFTGALTTDMSFWGGGLAYNNIWIATTGAYSVSIRRNNSFNDFKISAGSNVKFYAGDTQTVNTFTATGNSGNLITLRSTSTTKATLVKAGGGTISCDYMDVDYLIGSPDTTWYMGTNSTDGTHNTNIYFTDPGGPPPSSTFTPRVMVF